MLSRGGTAERLSDGNLDSASQPMGQPCAMGWSQVRRANSYGLKPTLGMPRDRRADCSPRHTPRIDFI